MMNDRVTLQKRVTAEDAIGRPVDDWSDVATVWSNVRFQSGAEVIRTNAELGVTKASIRIRKRTDVDVGMRVVFKTWTFELKGPPLPDASDNRFAFLVCESVK